MLEYVFVKLTKKLFKAMSLFMIVVCYITLTCLLMGYSIWTANQYKAIEQEAKKDQGAKILEEWREYSRKGKDQGRCGHFFNIFWNHRYNQAYLRYQYVELNKRFYDQHHGDFPGMDRGFEFYIYLRKCVRQACINIAMIHWKVWLTILIIIFFNTLRIVAFETSEVSSFIILDGIVLWLVTFYIFYLRHATINAIHILTAEYQKYQHLSGAHKSEAEEEDGVDEEEAKHLEDERIMKGGPGCCGRGTGATSQQKLFTCHSPATTARGMQLALLLISISVPLYIMELSSTITHSGSTIKILVNACIGIPPALLLTLGIPPIIPRFVMCSSIASMSRPTMIRDTIKKLDRERRYAKKHGGGKHGEPHKSKSTHHVEEEDDEHKHLTHDEEHA